LTPNPETIPPVPTNIVHGEFKQNEKGHYSLPLFDESVET
jgi:hypothetical protein